MRLRVQIVDESSKLNLNLTRPPNVNAWRAGKNPNPNQSLPFQSWKAALGQLLTGRGLDEKIADSVADYWDRLYDAAYGQGTNPVGGTPGAGNPTPGRSGQTSQTPTPGAPNG